MPELDEGDLMYTPTYPVFQWVKPRALLQTDKLIATLPEVETVFGKMDAQAGHDPAPLTMIEPSFTNGSQWRAGDH